jgi:hypothetical protein
MIADDTAGLASEDGDGTRTPIPAAADKPEAALNLGEIPLQVNTDQINFINPINGILSNPLCRTREPNKQTNKIAISVSLHQALLKRPELPRRNDSTDGSPSAKSVDRHQMKRLARYRLSPSPSTFARRREQI